MREQLNVVIIMSDQHHCQFMGCGNDPIIKTPALDALAARGTQFHNAYCAFPLCCPSRMAFMTGQMPSRLNCLDNNRQLDSDTPTFAHLFGASGYETVLAGRMHFNGPDQRHGFHKRLVGDVTPFVYGPDSESIRTVLTNGPWFTGPTAASIVKSGPGACAYEQYDQVVARTAADWITSRKSSQPYMMTVGFVLPHAPFVCSQEDFDTYDALVSEDDLPPWQNMDHPELKRFQEQTRLLDTPGISRKDQRRARVAYYGMCASVDRQVKQVIDAIESAGQTHNTLIVYVSDHGEQTGEHGLWWKHTFYEGSAGVPMIFAGPGVAPNQKVSQNVSLLDLGPTLLEMTGCDPIPGAQGSSFQCLLDERTQNQWHDTVYAENLWPTTATCLQRMVKQGPWKLCVYPGYESLLFNTSDDPEELHNHAADPAMSGILAKLTSLAMRDWDPGQLMTIHRQRQVSGSIRAQAMKFSDVPEPDLPWYQGHALQNHVDTSR